MDCCAADLRRHNRWAGKQGEETMRLCILGFVAAMLALGPAAAEDVPGSSDHPLVPRYEGAEIVRYETEAFTDHRMLTAPARAYGGLEQNLDATVRLEGALTQITYRAPAERSSLEVARNYQQALQAAGFEAIFSCSAEECGGRNFNHAAAPRTYYMGFGEYHAEQRYLAARLARPEGDVYASVYVVMNKAGGGPDKDRAMVQLNVVELRPMEERMVVVEASDMQRDLAADGRVAVYGILFDFDSDRMRPDSRPQLEEIGKLLKDSSGLEVLIVGHTDSQGGFDYNVDLSKRRAASVVDALVGEHGIERARLTPVGVGMAAPVATNRSEDGRARNRRVELVER
jgi:OmpA-OmpF porin, OOP family